MFSSHLRSSVLWQSISKPLSEHEALPWKETDTDRYDILVLDASGQTATEILVIHEEELPAEYQRLDKWLYKNTETCRTVIMVSSGHSPNANSALQKLQIHMLETGNLVPILPIPGGEHILPVIKAWNTMSESLVPADTSLPSADTVMAHCTSYAPSELLSEREIRAIRRICGSIKGLEEATRTVEGQKLLCQHLSKNTVQGLVQFWQDEWLL